MKHFELPGIIYTNPYRIRNGLPDEPYTVKKPYWYQGAPYRISPLPELPIPPLIHRIPRPAYLNEKPKPWK